MTQSFDVVVIGAGPAGYVAAIRCAQLGLQTACIDNFINREGMHSLGGTCLNAGCIPSKALLESSEIYLQAQHEFSDHGLSIGEVKLDLARMQARKSRIVNTLTSGIDGLFKSNKITKLPGHGKLLPDNKVLYTPLNASTSEEIQAKYIILASGSKSVDIGVAPVDNELIVDSWGALEFAEVPKRLGVIGAGVIGLELGSVWRRLGAEVVLLEAQQQFLAFCDEDIARAAQKSFTKQGLDIRLGCRVTGTRKTKKSVVVSYTDADNAAQELEVDKLIVCVGRRPNTDNLISPEVQIEIDEKGYIDIDENCRTNQPNIFAIGDVVRGPMLAHKGSEEGIAAAEHIAGMASHVNYEVIPSVIYTHPELAWVGKTEAALKKINQPYKVGVFPYAASGRAMAMGQTEGLVKILADEASDRILGVHIFGQAASELIAEAVVAMEFAASSEDLARIIHAHPTLSEIVHEAALAVDKRAIHIRNR